MKTNFWKFAAAFVVGLAAVVSCDKQKPEPVVVEPVFPEDVLVENVEAGATVEVSFEANLDWELSIPAAEQNKYWLDDAGVPASKVSGKAGAQKVSVVFSEDVYYDANVLCEVTLTMGGKSKVIAQLTRLAINRALEVYVAEKTEYSFKTTYGTEKATALELTTFTGDVTYTLPIQVVANYDWSLALPEWCAGSIKDAETLSGKAGQVVEVLLTGNVVESVKAGATGVAKFIDATDNAQSMELPLTFPAFADRIEWSEPSSMMFDRTGASSVPAIGYVLAMEGYVIRALGWNGKWHDLSYADWVTVTPGESSEGLLKQVAVTIGVTENTGKERFADLFLFPASMANVKADEICEDNDACSFKSMYEPYYIGRLSQKGETPTFITLYNNPEDEYDQFNPWKATLEPATDASWWQYDIHESIANIEANNKLTLTYSHPDAVAALQFAGEYASYKIYDYATNEVAENEEEDFWLTYFFMSGNGMGRISMDPDAFVAPDLNEDGTPDSVDPESFIVFFDANGNALAAVQCKYSSTPSGGATDGVSFTVQSGSANFGGLADMGLPAGSLNAMIGGLGVAAQEEMVIMASSQVVEYKANFNFSQIFIINLQGMMVENTDAFSVYQSSNTTFRVTAANESNYLLVFMDSESNVPVVVYYTCYL